MTKLDKETLNRWASAALERRGYSPQRARDAKREAWWWLKARAAARPGRSLYAGHAVVWTHPGRCELLPIEEPGPASGEVTVAVAHSVVSAGTERASYTGRSEDAQRYPARPGYSAAGVVLAAGREAGFSPGDRVAAPLAHCSVGTIAAASAYRVPEGVPLEEAAFAQLGVIAGRGVAAGELRPGERVCVLGAGVVGLLAARLAAAAGARDVTVVARSRRGETAARVGGADFRSTDDGEGVEGLDAELVLEATGDPQALLDAVAAAGSGGRIVVLGSPRAVTRDVPLDLIRAKAVTVIGGHVSTLFRDGSDPAESFRLAGHAFLEQLAAGAVAVADLAERRLDPREAPAFYRRLGAGASVTAARFDWTLLGEGERARRASRLAPPRLAARGVDFGGRPLEVPASRARRLAGDPLRGARGSLGIAVVGCGDIGVQNAAAVAAAPNARLVACYDPLSELATETARAHGADAARSLDELFARDDVEAVFVSVPHDLHVPLAAQAAEAGRHVIVEKPPAESLEGALELVDAASRHGVCITVCFPHRYDSAVAACRSLVAEGALGELRGTYVSFLTDKPPSYWHGGFSGRAASDWRASRARAGGGVLIMNLSHYLDLLLHLGGAAVEAVTGMVASVDPAAEVEDLVTMSVRYANGAAGAIFGGAAVAGTWEGRASTELRLWGDDGHVSLGTGLEVYSLRPVGGLRAARWHSFPSLPSVELRTAFVSRFATTLHEGRGPDVTLEEAVAVQAVIEATYRSAEERREVRVAELLETPNATAVAR